MYGKVCINLTAALLLALPINPSGLRADSTSPTLAGTVSPSNALLDTPAPDIGMLGRWYGGPVYTSVVSGGHLYYGTGGAIHVLKIRNAASQDATAWREVASIESSGVVRGLDAAGKYLYVADDSGAMRIIDISKSEKPREIGHVDLPDFVRAVSVEGQYAYLATGWSGLTIIDISNPDQPRLVQTLKSVGYITDVHVTGSLALVVGHKSGLRLVDVSNPLQPREIGHHELPGQAHGVYASD